MNIIKDFTWNSVNNNIKFVDMNETNTNARGAIGISGNAELDGDN